MLKNILAALTLSLLLGRAQAQPQVFIPHTTIKLLNFYPIDDKQFWMTLSFNDAPILTHIISCIIRKDTFTSPLAYLTRHWQTTKVGHIIYHYPDNINLSRARTFEKNNETIAHKLGLTAENFDFYLTDNYQEIPPLLGYIYDPARVARTRDGSFASEHQIFAIQHNEDFSHDLIHYYVAKIRTNTRNNAAEEGLAYYWGNAYYTDPNRNMIDYPAQLTALKRYIHEHPDSLLLSLFDHNIKPFGTPEVSGQPASGSKTSGLPAPAPGAPSQSILGSKASGPRALSPPASALAPEVSARSILSARLFQLIEETRGTTGIRVLINCGKGDDNYFKTLESLTGINRSNFDIRLRALLAR